MSILNDVLEDDLLIDCYLIHRDNPELPDNEVSVLIFECLLNYI